MIGLIKTNIMYEQMIYKGRIREKRGQLEDFNNLPDLIKNNFIDIKNYINNYIGKEIEIKIFGSFYHGFYDDKSDYDIIVNENIDLVMLQNKIRNDLNLKIDIFNINKKTIIIP